MGCNCKKDINNDKNISPDNKNTGSMVLNIILFLMLVVVSPIITLIIIWVLFKHIILNKSIDIIAILKQINNKLIKNDDESDDSDDIDIETLNPEDYKLIGIN